MVWLGEENLFICIHLYIYCSVTHINLMWWKTVQLTCIKRCPQLTSVGPDQTIFRPVVGGREWNHSEEPCWMVKLNQNTYLDLESMVGESFHSTSHWSWGSVECVSLWQIITCSIWFFAESEDGSDIHLNTYSGAMSLWPWIYNVHCFCYTEYKKGVN